MRLRATLTLGLLLLGHAAIPAADDVGILLAGLASDDFDDREAAFAALMERGSAAWPQLERALANADSETAARIAQIGGRVRPLPLADCETVANAMDLFLGDDPEQRAYGLDELLSLGQPGIRLAQQKLSACEVDIQIDLTIDGAITTMQLGELTGLKAAVRNSGAGGLWACDRPVVNLSADLTTHFSGQSVVIRRCGFVRRLCIRRAEYINPIRYWRYFLPGQLAAQQLEFMPETPGIYNISASFALVRESKIEPRLPDHCNRTTVPLYLNDGLPQEKQYTSAQKQIIVLPNFEFPIVNRQLEMRVSGPASAPAGGVLPIELTIQSREIESRELQLERSFMTFAWYAIVNVDGKPVQWGNLESLLENCDGDEPAAANAAAVRGPGLLSVAPTAPARFSLPVTMPADPGTYSVIFGYEVGEFGANCSSPRFLPRNETPYIRDDVFRSGKLYTRLETVRVK